MSKAPLVTEVHFQIATPPPMACAHAWYALRGAGR